MRKSMMILAAVAAAGILTYLFDPDRGRSRRARLADQTKAKAREAGKAVRARAEYQRGVIKGVAHDFTEHFEPDPDFDDETLLQKVRSEALGYLEDKRDIEIDIRDGRVVVSGSIANDEDHDRLLQLIRDVRGVRSVEDRIAVS